MNSYRIGSANERYRKQVFAPGALLLQVLLGAAVLGFLLLRQATELPLIGQLNP